MLEQMMHPSSCFLTLTYDEEHLPARGELSKVDVKTYLQRELYHGGPFRYYVTGEYGDRTWRPHYHAALFGRDYGLGMVKIRTWTAGHVYSGGLSGEAIRYVCGYLTKRMTNAKDKRLERIDPDTGEVWRLAPEFSLMSLRPGLGTAALRAYGKFLGTTHGKRFVSESGDVPSEVRIGGKRLPLGRYLKDKLRDYAYVMPSLRPILRQDKIRAMQRMRAAVIALDSETQQRRSASRVLSQLRGERISRKVRGGL